MWEQKLCNEFIKHYFSSAPDDIDAEDTRTLRLSANTIFPGFDKAHYNEKESFIEASESLEKKGIVKLKWEKHGKGERIRTLSCGNLENLFAEANRPFPQTEAKKIREFIKTNIENIKEKISVHKNSETEKIIALLENISVYFSSREIGQGIDQKVMEDLILFLEYSCNIFNLKKITIRALSVLLYRSSKRLEELLTLCAPLLTRSQKNFNFPHLVLPERSYPETMISGKLIFEFKNSDVPMINNEGIILNLPLESTEYFKNIKTIKEKDIKKVLTIENKETFYALGSLQKQDNSLDYNTSENTSFYDCFLYTGGYPNRAAAVLIKILASFGFTFFHAGDLDPDGILILQNISDIAQKPVTPVKMDAAAFDQYRPWARILDKPKLNQIKKIREETRAIQGISELIQRIEETGLGVEQEIIDYW